jgi:uncharacterized membrane protein (DUF4010 family)
MTEGEIFTRLGLALAIGFLIGVERGWGSRTEAEGERTAGLRTFALIGLSGGIWALLAEKVGPVGFAAGFLAVGAGLILFRWRETQHEKTFGATTLVAALLTFALGSYAVIGDTTAAAAAGVATAGILAAKGWLHSWLRALSWAELRATLILLAMSVVALPVLPNRGFGPYDALNPYELWLMTIAIAGVSFIGYVAVKIAGSRYGPLIAGIAGGLVSSTITTLDLARKAKAAPATARFQLAGALAASAIMFARVGVVVALFGPELLARVAGSLAAAFVVSVAAAAFLDPPWVRHNGKSEAAGPPLTNPFELRTVLLFGLMLAVITLLSTALTQLFGGRGGVAFAAIAGIGDVDAITLSMTQVAGGTVSAGVAGLAILTAVAANSLSKSVLAVVTGGRWFGLAYAIVSVVALAAGAVMATASQWTSP